MIILMGILFIVGYMLISLEHQIKINKGAIALILSIVLWTIYMIASPGIVLNLNHESFEFFLTQNSGLRSTSQRNQVVSFVADTQLLQQVGDVAEVIFFLLGAMAVVEMIDAHKGFCIITDKITTHNKERLLWILSGITFFLSAVIDNMTTAIVMVTLLSKIIPDKQERWWYASLVVMASNAGGAWSPIGDVTSIMVWVKGAITPLPLVKYLLLPSLVSVLLPLCWVTRMLHRAGISTQITSCTHNPEADKRVLATDVNNHSLLILMLGIVGLLLVPVYKSLTHLPPFTGVLLVLGVLWAVTDWLYRSLPENISSPLRLSCLVKRIDLPTLLFFIGILLSVGALDVSGVLVNLSHLLEANFQNVYIINIILGLLSAVIDNVPLVAAALGLYPLVDPSMLSTMADAHFMANFVPNGVYWHFLTYCTGVGGSLLIIGSAAGVVVMGIEKITFVWYMKHISFIALIGFLAGAAVYAMEVALF